MTFYRKYRPQTIEDLDNEEVRKRLTAVLLSNHIPHAFLFTGPKGIGKTSSARIIAKAINCTLKKKDKNIEPCNKCDACESITNGTSMDVIEIDAASNRGIDEIRDLREKIKLSPSSLKYKVYIIDEVHMLTTEAFNALLKTLEEPPEHAVFILCTTEVRKLPETILSRCMRFDFKKAKISELERSLGRIIKSESLKVEEKALHAIAKSADGSFREAAKVLEQLSFENKDLTEIIVNEFLGKISANRADELLKLLALKDSQKAILWINSALQNGSDIKVLTIDLLELSRNFLIKKAAGIENEEVEFGEAYEKLSIDDLRKLLVIFSQACLELKSAIIAQLPLELAIVEWCSSENQSSQPKTIKPEPKKNEPTKKAEPIKEPEPVIETKVEIIEEKVVKKENRGEIIVEFEKIVSLWPQILEAVKPLNHSVHAVLKSARPLAIENEMLVIEAFYKFHKERLEEPKVNTLLADVVCDKLGCRIGIKCVLGEKPKVAEKKMMTTNSQAQSELLKAAEEIFK